jgi:hypothetical protein
MSLMHGVELNEDGKPVWLRFGFLKLLEHLAYLTKEDQSPVPDWTRRFHSKVFRHRVDHFQQVLSKFDRAARHVANCQERALPWLELCEERAKDASAPDKRGETERADFADANADLPLYFDLLLLYLRIQADAYAALVPYFYEIGFKGKMPSDSFRGQLIWFTETRPNVDAGYASILGANQAWFHHLAGENPKGLRDVLVHHAGTTFFYWQGDQATEIALCGELYRSDGPFEENLPDRTREMTCGWCAFLDAACLHFVKNLKAKGMLTTMSGNDTESRWFPCGKRGLPSAWVYPSFKEPVSKGPVT